MKCIIKLINDDLKSADEYILCFIYGWVLASCWVIPTPFSTHSPIMQKYWGQQKKTRVAGPQDLMVDPASVLYFTYLYTHFCYMNYVLIDSIRYTDFGSSIYHINIYGHIRLLLFFLANVNLVSLYSELYELS